MSSTMIKRQDAKPGWILVDGEGQVLGRLAGRISKILQGKHKPGYTPHVDCGDYVVVINARKIRVTGDKAQTKEYVWHTRYPGGLRSRSYRDVMATNPPEILGTAVRKMLPKTRLGRAMLKKLKVYADAKHRHAANNPVPFTIPD